MTRVRLLAGGLALVSLLAAGCGSALEAETVSPAARAATSPEPPATTSVSPDVPDPAATSATPTATPTPTGTTVPMPPELFGRVWTTLPLTRPRIALTFDCGGNADGVASILATLRQKRVSRATFFLTGDWVRVYPTEAATIAERGYLLGNHTDNHLQLTDLTTVEVRGEVRRGRLAVLDATGVDPKPWFRFPFGAYDGRTLRVVNNAGWVAIGWTVDTLGWKGTSTGQSVDSVLARVLAAAQPGAIVLMHVGAHPTDHSTLDADALPQLITELRARGYRFTTPAALLSQ